MKKEGLSFNLLECERYEWVDLYSPKKKKPEDSSYKILMTWIGQVFPFALQWIFGEKTGQVNSTDNSSN